MRILTLCLEEELPSGRILTVVKKIPSGVYDRFSACFHDTLVTSFQELDHALNTEVEKQIYAIENR